MWLERFSTHPRLRRTSGSRMWNSAGISNVPLISHLMRYQLNHRRLFVPCILPHWCVCRIIRIADDALEEVTHFFVSCSAQRLKWIRIVELTVGEWRIFSFYIMVPEFGDLLNRLKIDGTGRLLEVRNLEVYPVIAILVWEDKEESSTPRLDAASGNNW